jgi:hypothetical protein
MRTLTLSAVLAASVAALPLPSAAQQPDKPFCLQQEGGLLSCRYDTMAQCLEANPARTPGGDCIRNPRFGTTSGAGTNPQPRDTPPPAVQR